MEKYKLRSRWVNMLSRCEDEDHLQYHDYGGRGITVCEEWHEFINFYKWCIENNVSSKMQLDRINNNKGYFPNNCKFVTRSQNARNKRNNKLLTAFGETKTMIDWSEDQRCIVNYRVLLTRMTRNWEHEKAITTPANTTRFGKIPANSTLLTAFGETKSSSEWLKDTRCKVNNKIIWQRIKSGWTAEDAISKPSRKITK